MATAIPLREDYYEVELSQVRVNIKIIFVEFIDCLKVRESELLRELDNILASNLSYRSELEKVNEKKRDLESMQNALKGVVSTSPVKGMQENILLQISTELKAIKTPIEPKMVSFVCDSNKMLAELNKLGKLVAKVISGIDYARNNHSQMPQSLSPNYPPSLNLNPYGQSVQSQYQPNVDRQIGNKQPHSAQIYCHQQQQQQWHCPHCTAYNLMKYTFCEVCYKSPDFKPDFQEVQSTPSTQPTRQCLNCSYTNRMQDVNCVKCGNSMIQAK